MESTESQYNDSVESTESPYSDSVEGTESPYNGSMESTESPYRDSVETKLGHTVETQSGYTVGCCVSTHFVLISMGCPKLVVIHKNKQLLLKKYFDMT